MTEPGHADPEVVTTVPMMLAVGAVLVLVMSAVYGFFGQVWGRSAFDGVRLPGGWAGAFAVFLASLLVHERLKQFVWKRRSALPWSAFTVHPTMRRFGWALEPAVPMRAADYRAGLVWPVVVLSVAPVVAAFATGKGVALLWGELLMFESCSDLFRLVALASVPGDAWIMALSGRSGFRLVSDAEVAESASESRPIH